jgi:hypothetical protein
VSTSAAHPTIAETVATSQRRLSPVPSASRSSSAAKTGEQPMVTTVPTATPA